MLSEKILLARTGNFTASENHRLMAGWDKPAPSRDYEEFEELYSLMSCMDKKPIVGFVKEFAGCKVTGDLLNKTWAVIQHEKPPQGLITYAEEKAIEEFFEPDPSLNFSTAHTRNGEKREGECMSLLAEATGLNFVNLEDDQVHIHADGVGVTPDGLVIDDLDLVETGAEVKCKSPLEHAKNMMIKDNADLMRDAFDHFVQIQTAMLVTGAGKWYFANYNPFAKDRKLAFGYIIIDRDNEFIKILSERIEIAKKIKADFYIKIQSKILTNREK
jgi:hypothetical protein